MGALWGGRFEKSVGSFTQAFGASLQVDKSMYSQDIKGSLAHARMLCEKGIISKADFDKIEVGLVEIENQIAQGRFQFDINDEDIHMAIEKTLIKDVGVAGARLHTGRSRNDQVATDTRLHAKDLLNELLTQNCALRSVIYAKACDNFDVIMPGYTHLQHAQPVLFSHHMLAYFWMFTRDFTRLVAAFDAADANPLGSAALAGTTYPLDRHMTTELLGFDHPIPNSMDAVSDRDYLLDLEYACSVSMMHLSRLCEEIILWSTTEFGFVTLSDSFATGSSIMPQKKNPDFAELTRGKCGRVYGDLVGLLTMLKGLPMAYNKDMQEDKEGVFDACDTVSMCLPVMTGMIETMTAKPEAMKKAAQRGFINATDLADYLVRKGLPFRSAYKISGAIVGDCVKSGAVLEELPLETYQQYSDLFDSDVYEAIDLTACVEKRTSAGGPAKVQEQIDYVTACLAKGDF